MTNPPKKPKTKTSPPKKTSPKKNPPPKKTTPKKPKKTNTNTNNNNTNTNNNTSTNNPKPIKKNNKSGLTVIREPHEKIVSDTEYNSKIESLINKIRSQSLTVSENKILLGWN